MTRLAVLLALGVPLLLAGRAPALDLAPRDVHARAGLSLDPDQVHVGVQADFGPRGRIAFRPSFDVGVGNGLWLFSLNGDVLYRFAPAGRLRPFLGAGPALSLSDVTDGVGEMDGLSAGLAGHALAGLEWRLGGARTLVEARAGFGDTADFKLTLGVAF
jgi:hypothetical protein